MMGKYDPEYYKKNADKIRKINNDWYKANPEINRASHRRTYHRWRDAGLCVYCGGIAVPNRKFCEKHQISKVLSARKHRLKRLYKKTQREIDMMLEQQEYRCAICRISIADKYCIDHDHKTEKVRGLLCGSCNRGIGHFSENIEALKTAALYLESHR